ncbi:MAG TPA: PadR family transcriptional regulator [Vicinamibacterales bacterium]|nr:PadR family transcriptional regulator [Vicinamibacterales bacterium]
MPNETLGRFELQVLLAVMHHGDDAYGVPVADAIDEASGRETNAAHIYLTLDRLEEHGFVTSHRGESTPERGGEAKMYFRVTGKGLRAARDAQRTSIKSWNRVPNLQGATA